MSSNAASFSAPPLATGIRLRLSGMMFLQFAVWGSWFTVFNVYCNTPVAEGGLGFDNFQIGSLYGTMALGAIVSMLIAGQLADRVLSSEYLMAIFHLAGAGLLFAMSQIHDYNMLWWVALAYAFVYNPTLSISSSLSFSNIPDSTRDFPTLRVLGTIGWICAGLAVDYVLPKGSDKTNRPLLMAAGLSGVLGLMSFALPHTPPTGKKGDTVPFLRAIKLLGDPSFGIFFGISFVITIALAFYYGFAGSFLKDKGVTHAAATQTIGQGSEIFFMLLLPFALKKFGMKGVLGVGMAAWAVRYGLFSLGHPFALILIGVGLHGVCFDFFLAAGFIHTDNKAPADIRGSAQALFSFLTYGVGMYIGNVVSGAVVNHFTVVKHVMVKGKDVAENIVAWSNVWAVPAAGAAVCLVLFLILWRDSAGKVEETQAVALATEPLV
ncbi:MAG TPA: MFS transporter [Tepidisphaeraceae bacterium]|nr:MFS transporter [Tepidisphaeraceae bacterium]